MVDTGMWVIDRREIERSEGDRSSVREIVSEGVSVTALLHFCCRDVITTTRGLHILIVHHGNQLWWRGKRW